MPALPHPSGFTPLAPDILDTARMLRSHTSWERRLHEYELLLNAGLSPDEASAIIDAQADD